MGSCAVDVNAGLPVGSGTMSDKEQVLQKAREATRDTALKAQILVRDRWRDFRATSIYFQLRVLLVAAWVGVSGVTLTLAPPPVLPFLVERRDVSFGAAERTEVLVVNQNGGDLDEAVVEVQGSERDLDGKALSSGTWTTKPFALPQGTKRTIATTDLFDPQGRSPHYQLEITRLRLLDDGDVVWSGVPGPRTDTKAK